MKTLKIIGFFFTVVWLVTSCRKDEVTAIDKTNFFQNTENVKFQFTITNEIGESIDVAQINIGAEVYETDANGVAITKAYDVAAIGLRAEISASGYETLIKMVSGPKDATKLESVILSKSITNVIGAGSTGQIDGGGLLSLPPILSGPNGSLYSGEVTVKSKYLNPDNEDYLLSAPGNLLALDGMNEFQQLASLGMYLIELYDSEGSKLDIPEGSTATITFPIASKHKDLDLTEIPLWYFDEESGIWMEDGKAIVEGGKMVAEVRHFTWWNCDLPYVFTEICLLFLNPDETTIPGLHVIFSVNGVAYGNSITDANGVILAKVPIDEEIQLQFILYGMEIGTKTVGPFDENDRKLSIYIDVSLQTISGMAKDCDAEPLSNGYAYIIHNNEFASVALDADGKFFYSAPESDHTLSIIDKNTNNIATLDILEGDQKEDLGLGNITVCEGQNKTKLSGHVIIDTDGDNIGDTPYSNDKVWIQNKIDFTIYSIQSDEDGYYEVNVIPTIPYSVYILGEAYTVISAGDKSPEGNVGLENYELGQYFVNSVVDEAEHDIGNDFLVIPFGEGIISGTFMGDSDNDGIGDVPLEWVTIKYHETLALQFSKLVKTDGTFYFGRGAGYWELSTDLILPHISDYDITPDPDGDDSGLGSNEVIPVILQDGEEDSDNNFVIDMSNRMNLLCQVLEDTDFDGIGDVPVQDVKITVEDRGSSLVLTPSTTNELGLINRGWNGPDFIYLNIGIKSTEYEIIDLVETAPDNDPFIVDNDITTMVIDLVKGEWDAGNIFVVRKK